MCFSSRSENQDGCPGLWFADTFSTFSLQRNIMDCDRKQNKNVINQVCVFQADRKTKIAVWPLIGWNIFDFFFSATEQNSQKLDRKQDLNVLFQVWVFQGDRKTKMATLASDLLKHFWLLLCNRLTEFNDTSQEHDCNVLYQVRVFLVDRKTEMVTLASGCSSVIEYSRNLIWPRSIFFILSVWCWFSYGMLINSNNVWIWGIIQICKTFARIWQISFLL